MADPVAIRPAATILMVRDDPEYQVLMVQRHHQIDFASGALVFPGGKIDAADHDPIWSDHTLGWEALEPAQRPLRIAAIREAFEEVGILIARHGAGESFVADERAVAARAAVAQGERSFIDLVRDLGVRLDLSALTVFARWITPTHMPKRFDTWFYAVRASEDQLAVCDGWETVDVEWIAPAEAVRLGETGERTVVFPTRLNLQLMAESSSAAEVIDRAAGRTLVTVEPYVESRDGERMLVIQPDAGYGAVVTPLALVK